MTLQPGKMTIAAPFKCTNTPKGDNKLYSDAGGYAPSLDLRFASDKNLNDFVTNTPLVDHQRSMSGSNLSAGTFVNSSGLIETAKVNLASNSNYGTGWSKSFFAQTPVLDATGPDNITNSAFTLVANNSGGNNYVEAITPTVTVKTSTSYTVSFFAKADTLNYAMIRTNGFTTPADFKRAYFDLLTGVTGERNAGDSSDIVSYGGGWYRCIYTFTTDPTDTTGNFYIGLASGTTDATASYLAPLDGVSSVVLFGLQVEEGTTASPYIPTTGVASAAPRFDHDPTTGESLGLLVEESRTNLVTYSEDLTTWTSSLWTITPNATTAPDGNITADVAIPNVGTSSQSRSIGVSVVLGTTYTASIFAKAKEHDSFYLRPTGSNSYRCRFDLVGNGNAVPISGTAKIIPFPDSWYYCSYTFVEPIGGTRLFGIQRVDTPDGVSGFYVWGAQLEAGSFATSYIPTSGTALTRSADVASITGSNFSSWYNQSEGTILTSITPKNTNNWAYSFSDGTPSQRIISLLGNIYSFYVVDGGSIQAQINYAGYTANTETKAAGAYAINDIAYATDGSVRGTDSSATIPAVNKLVIMDSRVNNGSNKATGHISRLTYFPDRLEDSVLQAITQ